MILFIVVPSLFCGAPEGIRTPDHQIKSLLLFLLSYERVLYKLYILGAANKPSAKHFLTDDIQKARIAVTLHGPGNISLCGSSNAYSWREIPAQFDGSMSFVASQIAADLSCKLSIHSLHFMLFNDMV